MAHLLGRRDMGKVHALYTCMCVFRPAMVEQDDRRHPLLVTESCKTRKVRRAVDGKFIDIDSRMHF